MKSQAPQQSKRANYVGYVHTSPPNNCLNKTFYSIHRESDGTLENKTHCVWCGEPVTVVSCQELRS